MSYSRTYEFTVSTPRVHVTIVSYFAGGGNMQASLDDPNPLVVAAANSGAVTGTITITAS